MIRIPLHTISIIRLNALPALHAWNSHVANGVKYMRQGAFSPYRQRIWRFQTVGSLPSTQCKDKSLHTPEAMIRAGISIMGLIDEILHYMTPCIARNTQTTCLTTPQNLNENTAPLKWMPLVHLYRISPRRRLSGVYAPRAWLDRRAGMKPSSSPLEELLLLKLQLNPAFLPFFVFR